MKTARRNTTTCFIGAGATVCQMKASNNVVDAFEHRLEKTTCQERNAEVETMHSPHSYTIGQHLQQRRNKDMCSASDAINGKKILNLESRQT